MDQFDAQSQQQDQAYQQMMNRQRLGNTMAGMQQPGPPAATAMQGVSGGLNQFTAAMNAQAKLNNQGPDPLGSLISRNNNWNPQSPPIQAPPAMPTAMPSYGPQGNFNAA
ncbi:hypothetical protein [Variovorax sp. LG9.2]|uniref:hypothetical protein n=1 Tax=Variovorax sp. LG9.2 TaxID=3048626 RepID=UPI002B2252B7|nr:hypothetical protein [Variovorax sp. LG9.2]MEB0057318.1 hypothetical protein [Variovorax sp. LG9.2]